MSDEPVAYLCEVKFDGWHEHLSQTHPDELFEEVPHRDVRPLVEADDV